jgi:hypothetical protein
MRFECRSTFYPKPTDPTHYFQTNEMDVRCHTVGDEPTIAARLAVDYLDIARAVSDGQSILHLCDADSSGWMQVYEATIEPDIHFTGIREDFGFDDPIHGIVFIYGVVLHADLLPWQRFIIDSVCRMFPHDTATVMWNHTTELEPAALASIGFRKIAGSELLFRPNMLENEYTSLQDDRDTIDLVVAEDAQDHVDDQWARLDGSGSFQLDEEE